MKIVCLDTEHSSSIFNPWELDFYLTCVGVIVEEGGERTDDLIWFDHKDAQPTDDGLVKLQAYIDDADLLIFHNAKHDINVLRGFGIDFDDTRLWCTMITDYLIEGQNKELKYSLDAVAERYGLGQKHDEIKEYWKRGEQTYDIPDWKLGPYCIQDVNLTLDIYHAQIPRVEKADLGRVVKLQNEYTYCLSDMEYNGLLFDTEVLDEIVRIHQEKARSYSDKVLVGMEYASDINLSSPQQVSAVLYGGVLKFKRLQWEIKTFKYHSTYKEYNRQIETPIKGFGFRPNKKDLKADGYYKVDKDTIAGLNAPTATHRRIKKLLVKYSEHAKVVSTLQGRRGDKGLLSKVQPDGCIHPTLNQTVAATGRLTSSNPNGQNLPRGNTSPIKTCFVPRYDGIMQVDLSQVEWRNAAWLSQDPVMIDEINNGVDQHIATVKELMELEFISKKDKKSKENRDNAKVFNFRMIYGGSEWGFFLDINMPNFPIKKWRKIIRGFFDKYSKLEKFHKECIRFVFRNGYLKLPTGRWFKFNKQHLKDGSYGYKINQIKNYPVQGMSGGDILPLMAVVIRRGMRKLGLKSLLILTVHDSIVFDVVEEERDRLAKLCYDVGNNLGKYVANYYKLDWNVDLEVEVEYGPNYGALKFLPMEEVV